MSKALLRMSVTVPNCWKVSPRQKVSPWSFWQLISLIWHLIMKFSHDPQPLTYSMQPCLGWDRTSAIEGANYDFLSSACKVHSILCSRVVIVIWWYNDDRHYNASTNCFRRVRNQYRCNRQQDIDRQGQLELSYFRTQLRTEDRGWTEEYHDDW